FGDADLARRLFADARVGALVIDTGYPDPAVSLPVDELGTEVALLLRLELEMQDLVAALPTYDDLVGATRAHLTGARGRGFVGFKSIAGYRTGLDIRRWSRAEAIAAFSEARREVEQTGSVRLGHKPLLDTLLHVAFEVAAAEQLPVQFHVGYGDPDADLRSAHPLLLRDVLEERAYREMPVVLLHGCWPFFREGAYLAAVYGNAHLDLSYGIPFLSRPEMRSMTRAALGAAPLSKLMYSSDGARVPELHWLGAHDGRRLIGAALGELVDDGDLTAAQARRGGEQMLRDNARALYGLGGGE
ncbi:MAG: amidohydrolase family protein, partial [Actinomycetota bacterium]